jgi:adenylate cyclase
LALARVYVLAAASILRDAEQLGRLAPQLVVYCEEQKLDMFLASARSYSGCALVAAGRFPEGITLLRECVERQKADGYLTHLAHNLSWLAEAYLTSGALGDAARALDEGFATIRDEELWRPELLRLRGDLLAKGVEGLQATGDAASQAEIDSIATQAETAYRQAIELARGMGAHVFALRAATHLARFLQARRRTAEARALLAPVYALFGEGVDTRDLIEAKEVLEALPPAPTSRRERPRL